MPTSTTSCECRNPSQLRAGDVLVVGAGNSGAEIALEVAEDHPTWLSGRDVGHLPFHIGSTVGQRFFVPLVLRFLFHRVLTVNTWAGRKVRPKITSQGGPLIRIKPRELAAAGIERVPRVTGVCDGRPVLAGDQMLDVANVVWCTGYHPGFSWIDLPIFRADGRVAHESGIAAGEPGLYFVGLHFLHSVSSGMIHGVGRDAEGIVRAIASRLARMPRLSQPRTVEVSSTPADQYVIKT